MLHQLHWPRLCPTLPLAHTQSALRAEADGFDAVAMGYLLEPGVSAAREALQIPVVGEAGVAMHLASLVARKFSFLLPGANQDGEGRTMADLMRQYGFADHLASIRQVGFSTLAFTGKQEEGLAEIMLTEARAAVKEDGAQAIIGYGGLAIIEGLRRGLAGAGHQSYPGFCHRRRNARQGQIVSEQGRLCLSKYTGQLGLLQRYALRAY